MKERSSAAWAAAYLPRCEPSPARGSRAAGGRRRLQSTAGMHSSAVERRCELCCRTLGTSHAAVHPCSPSIPAVHVTAHRATQAGQSLGCVKLTWLVQLRDGPLYCPLRILRACHWCGRWEGPGRKGLLPAPALQPEKLRGSSIPRPCRGEQLTSVSSTGSRTCREVGALSVLSTVRRGRCGPGCTVGAVVPAGSAAAEVPAPLVSAMERVCSG